MRRASAVFRISIVAAGFGVALLALFVIGEADIRFSQDALQAQAVRMGRLGPAVIVAAMAAAVVASPIPSAPIALAAGALYGHAFGAVLVVMGAEIGAIIAFVLARVLGRSILESWLGTRLDQGLLGSQNALTFAVLVSRLLPFVSFDLVSYAAGLSVLQFWRFALATLAGVIPASFLLAHFGSRMASTGFGAAWAAIGLGAVTAAPLVWSAARKWRRRPPWRRNENGPSRH